MKYNGHLATSGLLFFIGLFLLGFVHRVPAKEIVFYSLPESIARENLAHLVSHGGSTRHYLPLMGEYQLFDQKNDRLFGQVRLPAAFHSPVAFTFKKRIQVPSEGKHHYFLHFPRLNGWAEIRFDNRLIYQGSHNFLPLRIPCPVEKTVHDTHLVEIKIRPWNGGSEEVPVWIPVNLPRIDNGILSSPFIEIAPETFINEVEWEFVSRGDSLFLQGEVSLHALEPITDIFNLQVQLNRQGRTIAQQTVTATGDSLRTRLNVTYRLHLPRLKPWSPDDPELYQAHFRLYSRGKLIDGISRKIAFRQVGWNDRDFILNGQPLKIQGLNYVYQDQQGVARINRKLIIEDLQQIKSKGFNTVRVGFYPQSALFYELTDSLGLLCFQDMPFSYMNGHISPDSLAREKLQAYLQAFIHLARNHPSVVGIGINREVVHLFQRTSLQSSALRELLPNSGRMVYYSCAADFPEKDRNENLPVCWDIVERNRPERLLAEVREKLPTNRPILVSALSKAISYRVDSTSITHDLNQNTELYRRLIQPQWQERLAGQFVLTFSDYYLQTPALQAGPQNNFQINTIGLFDLQRNLKKEASMVLGGNRFPQKATQPFSEKKDFGTFVFILLGLVNFLAFLVVYRSMIEFRHSAKRAIRKPHGFFTDLQERRMIPVGESIFLALSVSLNGGVIIGSILYFFRNNLFMDYLISLFLPDVRLKLAISYIIWKPVLLVLGLTVIFFFIIVLMALPVRLIAIFREPVVRLRQALAVSAWSAASFILLLPVGMFFYNLLLAMKSYWILMAVLLYFNVWYMLRWINGTRVMLGYTYSRALLFTMFVFIVLCTAVLLHLHHRVGFFHHLQYLIQLYQAHL
ncbi:MAG: hypothetical protein Kow0042_19020 [Calditrichia bacterium]